MAEEPFDDLWANWMAEEGLAIEDEIHQTLLASKGLLDIDDGTHAPVSYTHLTLPTKA